MNTLDIPTTVTADKVLATGGDLLARFANDVVLTFNGPDGFAADIGSELLLDVSQSVFQRDVVFERLTQAERDVVYAAREFARDRKTLFTTLARQYYNLLLGLPQHRDRRPGLLRQPARLPSGPGRESRRPAAAVPGRSVRAEFADQPQPADHGLQRPGAEPGHPETADRPAAGDAAAVEPAGTAAADPPRRSHGGGRTRAAGAAEPGGRAAAARARPRACC